jgi:hypothetical protein
MANICGWWVGPIPKLDDEVCVCIEGDGHAMPHRCVCGSWFEGCGKLGPVDVRVSLVDAG